ncbi:unnamed protein product, partial [Prunus brigantina]
HAHCVTDTGFFLIPAEQEGRERDFIPATCDIRYVQKSGYKPRDWGIRLVVDAGWTWTTACCCCLLGFFFSI